MGDVQCPHFVAASGTAIRHCGQSLVFGGGGAALASNRLTRRTITKMAAATIRKVITTLMNWP